MNIITTVYPLTCPRDELSLIQSMDWPVTGVHTNMSPTILYSITQHTLHVINTNTLTIIAELQ